MCKTRTKAMGHKVIRLLLLGLCVSRFVSAVSRDPKPNCRPPSSPSRKTDRATVRLATFSGTHFDAANRQCCRPCPATGGVALLAKMAAAGRQAYSARERLGGTCWWPLAPWSPAGSPVRAWPCLWWTRQPILRGLTSLIVLTSMLGHFLRLADVSVI